MRKKIIISYNEKKNNNFSKRKKYNNKCVTYACSAFKYFNLIPAHLLLNEFNNIILFQLSSFLIRLIGSILILFILFGAILASIYSSSLF